MTILTFPHGAQSKKFMTSLYVHELIMHHAEVVWQKIMPEFHRTLTGSGDAAAVVDVTRRALSQMGFDFLAYARLVPSGSESGGPLTPEIAFLNYPKAWTSYYHDSRFDLIDPVVRFSRLIGRPYKWVDLTKRLEESQQAGREVMDCAVEAGLKDGLTVPLLYPSGEFGLISFASECSVLKPPEVYAALPVIASMMHGAYLDRKGQNATNLGLPKFTERELECLRWMAEGKSSWDIGQILGIGECTVNYHVQKILRKFSTSNRVVAVCMALRQGLI